MAFRPEPGCYRRKGARGLQRWAVAALVAAQSFALAGSASASPEFPAVVDSELSMDCPPPCTICHTSPNGGAETAVQPFVETLRVAYPEFLLGEEQLAEGLALARTTPCEGTNEPCNIDGNDKSDIEDLEAGNDPNTGQPLACPKYGCGASSIAPERHTRSLDGTSALILLGAIGIMARRVRRR